MVAMMLPTLIPMLGRYRQAVARTGEMRLGRLTTLVGIGYFFVWTVLGMVIYPLGVALAAVQTQLPALAHAVPIAVGVIVLIAGCLQFTAWKARHLACCRGGTRARPYAARWRRPGLAIRRAPRTPLRSLCANLMAILGQWAHGPWRDGGRSGNHHGQTSRTGRRACCASHRRRLHRGRVVSGRASSRAPMMHPVSRPRSPTDRAPGRPSGVYGQGQNPDAAATSQRNRARKPSQVLGRTRF